MENKAEITITESRGHENMALMLLTKAEIDSQIATAKAFPRSIKEFIDTALTFATINEDIAASCSYSLPRAGKAIEGPSVRLAEICCSAYKNIRAGARVIDNDGKTITAQGICHDLESNNSVTVEVKRRITGKDGKTLSEDMQVVIGNAACAIAYRNAVYKVIPAAFIDEIYEKTKEVARGTAETLVKRRTKAIDYFKSLNITEKQICDALGIKKVEDIDIDKLTTLNGFRTAIKAGESTATEIFATKPDEKSGASKESERLIKLLRNCKTAEELDKLRSQCKSNEELDVLLEMDEKLSKTEVA